MLSSKRSFLGSIRFCCQRNAKVDGALRARISPGRRENYEKSDFLRLIHIFLFFVSEAPPLFSTSRTNLSSENEELEDSNKFYLKIKLYVFGSGGQRRLLPCLNSDAILRESLLESCLRRLRAQTDLHENMKFAKIDVTAAVESDTAHWRFRRKGSS